MFGDFEQGLCTNLTQKMQINMQKNSTHIESALLRVPLAPKRWPQTMHCQEDPLRTSKALSEIGVEITFKQKQRQQLNNQTKP